MKEKLFKKGIKRRLFSVVLALAMVLTLMPMNSMTAYAYDSLPTELNGLSVVWSAGWQINAGEITCGHLASISEYGSCCGIADAQNVLVDGISELHAGTYYCSGGSCTFTLSPAGGSGSGGSGGSSIIDEVYSSMNDAACICVLNDMMETIAIGSADVMDFISTHLECTIVDQSNEYAYYWKFTTSGGSYYYVYAAEVHYGNPCNYCGEEVDYMPQVVADIEATESDCMVFAYDYCDDVFIGKEAVLTELQELLGTITVLSYDSYDYNWGSAVSFSDSNELDYTIYIYAGGHEFSEGMCQKCGMEEPTPVTYTIEFDSSMGSGRMDNVTGVSGTYTLPACTFTPPAGKEFDGWTASFRGPKITTSTIEVTSDMVLWAVWKDAAPLHAHSWKYVAGTGDDSNKITAKCEGAGDCTVTNGKTDGVSLTLSASSANYSGIEGLDAFNEATGLSVSENDVEIYKVDAADTTEGGTKVTETPLADGYYYASLTVENETAVKAFTVGNPVPEKAQGPEAPANLVPYRPTNFDELDGKILGVDETMEYSTDNGESWTDVTGTAITGLEPGTVLVRVKETETTKAGESASIEIFLHRELIFIKELKQWRLYVGEEFQEQITGFVYQDEFFYVDNGIYNKAYLGLADYEGTLWYAKNGRLDKSFTGLADYQGTKIFTRNGKASYETGIFVDEDGVSYYIVDGLIDTTKTGLFYDSKVGAWKYFVEGVQATTTKGLVWHGGNWWYVANGQLDKSYEGLVWYGNAWYYVANGQLDKSYAGLTQYGGKLWYVSDGKLNKEFAGDVEYKGAEYTVANGIGTAK